MYLIKIIKLAFFFALTKITYERVVKIFSSCCSRKIVIMYAITHWKGIKLSLLLQRQKRLTIPNNRNDNTYGTTPYEPITSIQEVFFNLNPSNLDRRYHLPYPESKC